MMTSSTDVGQAENSAVSRSASSLPLSEMEEHCHLGRRGRVRSRQCAGQDRQVAAVRAQSHVDRQWTVGVDQTVADGGIEGSDRQVGPLPRGVGQGGGPRRQPTGQTSTGQHRGPDATVCAADYGIADEPDPCATGQPAGRTKGDGRNSTVEIIDVRHRLRHRPSGGTATGLSLLRCHRRDPPRLR